MPNPIEEDARYGGNADEAKGDVPIAKASPLGFSDPKVYFVWCHVESTKPENRGAVEGHAQFRARYKTITCKVWRAGRVYPC